MEFDSNTHQSVVDFILRRRGKRTKEIRIEYGDSETGLSWGDCESGFIGVSTGTQKIPLLLESRQSDAGCGILDNCIVKIGFLHEKPIYQHPKYHIASPSKTASNGSK